MAGVLSEVPAKRQSEDGDSSSRKRMVRLTPSPIVAPAAPKVVSLAAIKLPDAVPVEGIDNSQAAQQDRDSRFSSVAAGTKKIVSLKDTGGPPPPMERTQLGLGGARAGGIKGTSTALERPYLRLHFAPDPATIRPPEILAKALSLVKQKWLADADYAHASEQLMSIQQDCRLQAIQGPLACDAYETNVRISLEKGDLAELSRGLSSLAELYHAAFLAGQEWSGNCNEFTAYRILHGMRNEADILQKASTALWELRPNQREDADIMFALAVGEALMSEDHERFLRLYADAPKMAGYVIDFFVDRVRERALQVYVRACQPELEVDALKTMLRFNKRKECFRFLREKGMVMTDDKQCVDCKKSRC